MLYGANSGLGPIRMIDKHVGEKCLIGFIHVVVQGTVLFFIYRFQFSMEQPVYDFIEPLTYYP